MISISFSVFSILKLLCRFSSSLGVVPTDAEYAMELISQRVARGLDIKPKQRKFRPTKRGSQSDSDSKSIVSTIGSTSREIDIDHSSLTLQKLTEVATVTKVLASGVKRSFKGGQVSEWMSQNVSRVLTKRCHTVERSRNVDVITSLSLESRD